MVKVHCIHRVSNAIGVVIFVHGITGEYQETWKASDTDEDPFWPRWLERDFPKLSVFSFNYQSKLTAWSKVFTPDLIELANQARKSLERVEELLDKSILFICHSMGGLICKFMLRAAEIPSEDSAFCLIKQTRGVVFIAVPHAGAKKASFARKVGALVGPSGATKNMTWNDPHLAEIKRWYNHKCGDFGFKTWAFAAAEDAHVDPLSANPGVDGVSLETWPGDHSSVCKPRSREADAYLDIRRIVSRFQGDIQGDTIEVEQAGIPKLGRKAAVGNRAYHGYRLTRWTEPFPECAQLYVEPKQGTNRAAINAIAMVRCNRQRISTDEEIERAFYMSAKSIRLTIEVTGGEVDPYFGTDGEVDDRPCELSRAGDALVFDVWDEMPFLKGELYDGEWLPKISVHSFDDCEVDVRVGAYPEAISIDILDADHVHSKEVSDLKMKLTKVIACRALERVGDEIILSKTAIVPAERE